MSFSEQNLSLFVWFVMVASFSHLGNSFSLVYGVILSFTALVFKSSSCWLGLLWFLNWKANHGRRIHLGWGSWWSIKGYGLGLLLSDGWLLGLDHPDGWGHFGWDS